MNKIYTIIVDADAIIAQISLTDKHHQVALKISELLVRINAQVFYPATTIPESNAYIQRVLNDKNDAFNSAEILTNINIQIAEINYNTIKHAMKFFSPTSSKKNTLFDCIVAAVAEEYNADAIFSFDKFYKKNGFKLAEELL